MFSLRASSSKSEQFNSYDNQAVSLASKYLGLTHIWISKLPLTEWTGSKNPETEQEEHRALRHFLLPSEKYAELNDQSRAKVDWRNEQQLLLPDPLAILNRLIELLDHPDWVPLAVAHAGLTGRRIGEVLLSGKVSWKSAYSVTFSGRLKRRGEPEKGMEIPTACEAQRVVAGWERVHTPACRRPIPTCLKRSCRKK